MKSKLQFLFIALIIVFHLNIFLMGSNGFVGKTVSRDLLVEKWITKKPTTQGKFILIDFWRTWCGPCLRSMDGLNKIQESFGDQLVIVGITSESESDVRKSFNFITAQYSLGIESKELKDKEFGIQSFPHGVLIDPSGIVRWVGNPLDSDPEFNRKFVRKIIDSYKRDGDYSVNVENQSGEEVPPLYLGGKSHGVWKIVANFFFVGAVIIILLGISFELSRFMPDGFHDLLIGGILGMIVLVFLFHFYDKTGHSLYAYLIPLSLAPYFSLKMIKKSKQEYMKRFAKPSDPDMWICTRCGEETHKINRQCVHCGEKKS